MKALLTDFRSGYQALDAVFVIRMRPVVVVLALIEGTRALVSSRYYAIQRQDGLELMLHDELWDMRRCVDYEHGERVVDCVGFLRMNVNES
ncbi:hypothetical protein M422DRAFT_254538 [Sphaerobolus stellatus SS14]|uniref:Uncharacterized protein n=1 Tax=Sphaerobolus stellatus (strain SS14) TaxID=990650 RepID=A0A0C9VL76_SPHS4|nr:hypothetical protein M422DRAFT_254538 [Sphaerobolus stellatus SS14]